MWKVLVPLVILIVVLLAQLQMAESFTGTGTTSGGTITDASGNVTDASGNTITTTASKTTITLTLADLLALFRNATPAPQAAPVSQPAAAAAAPVTTTEETTTPADFYKELRPQLLRDIAGITSTQLAGSPYEPSAPLSCGSPMSDSAAQGIELQNVRKDYIKRDEIPCYGCSL